MFKLADCYLATEVISDPKDGSVVRADNARMDRIDAPVVPCRGQIVLRVEGNTTGPVTSHRMEVFAQDADGKTWCSQWREPLS